MARADWPNSRTRHQGGEDDGRQSGAPQSEVHCESLPRRFIIGQRKHPAFLTEIIDEAYGNAAPTLPF